MGQQIILKIIQEAKAPVTLKTLQKQTRIGLDELARLLAAEGERGTIHRWPETRRQQRFWHRSPDEVVREQVLQAASECALPPPALAKQVKKRMPPGHPAKLVSAAIQQLIRESQLHKYPGFGKEKLLLGREGCPAAYAMAARGAMQAIMDKLSAEGVHFEAPPAQDLQSVMLEAMARIEPARTAPVSISELRAAFPQADKRTFDEAALNLRAQQRAFLSRHDFPQSLPPEERDALIDGRDGTYYVAITARTE